MFFQLFFVNVQRTSINIRRFNFNFQTNINIETKLGSSTWNRLNSIDVSLTLLCQRWNNFDNVPQLNFHFQPNINLETTWQRWNNADKCTWAQLSFLTNYQRWNNVDERWRSTLFQSLFVDHVFARKYMTLTIKYRYEHKFNQIFDLLNRT